MIGTADNLAELLIKNLPKPRHELANKMPRISDGVLNEGGVKIRCAVSLAHLERSTPKELLASFFALQLSASFACSSAFIFTCLRFSFHLHLPALQLSASFGSSSANCGEWKRPLMH